jgi:hypothetical protein
VLDVENEVFADSRSRPVKLLYDQKRQVLELLVISDALYDPITRVTRTCSVLAPAEVHGDMEIVETRSTASRRARARCPT